MLTHLRRNDKYIKEDDVNIQELVAETLRSRGFGVEGDDMDQSS
jgi:hypothetical protein